MTTGRGLVFPKPLGESASETRHAASLRQNSSAIQNFFEIAKVMVQRLRRSSISMHMLPTALPWANLLVRLAARGVRPTFAAYSDRCISEQRFFRC